MSEQNHAISGEVNKLNRARRRARAIDGSAESTVSLGGTSPSDQTHTSDAASRDASSLLGAVRFKFEGRMLRTIMKDDDPWFVLADVCRALKLGSHKGTYSSHIEKLDADEVEQVSREAVMQATPGFNPGVGVVAEEWLARSWAKLVDANDPLAIENGATAWLVSESGLYTMMLRSRGATTPGTLAHRFRRWVTSEVLPSIRRTGSYSAKGPQQLEAKQIGWTVAIPGEGRYIVTAAAYDDIKVHATGYVETMAEMTALDCQILACTCLQTANFWRRVQELRAIGLDPAGGFALEHLDRAILSGAALGRQFFLVHDKTDAALNETADPADAASPFAG